MKDYRAATWAIVATALTAIAAAGAIPASAAVLGLAAGCSALAFLHALLRPRTETVEIQLGAVNIVQAEQARTPPSAILEALMSVYACTPEGVYVDRDPDAGEHDCHPACPCNY